jgi:geranylgeranyl transferase type-2 subunit beta
VHRLGDVTDVFHMHFEIARLSFMGYEGLKPVNVIYCLPVEKTKHFGLED